VEQCSALPVTESTQKLMRMKVSLVTLACMAALSLGAPAPKAEPKAFVNLGAVALPAITGNALIDGLLLGKVAFLKAAILANLLLGSDEAADDSYGAPAEEYGAPVDSYGEPAVTYEEPAPSYEQPSYEAPAPAAPEVDTYGSPAADPLPAYHAARY